MIGNAVSIEVSRDLFCRMTLLDVLPKNPLNHLNFFRWAKLKDDPVGFQVLLLTAQQIPLRKPILVDQLATKSVGQWTTSPESQCGYPALPGMNLCGKLTAELRGSI